MRHRYRAGCDDGRPAWVERDPARRGVDRRRVRAPVARDPRFDAGRDPRRCRARRARRCRPHPGRRRRLLLRRRSARPRAAVDGGVPRAALSIRRLDRVRWIVLPLPRRSRRGRDRGRQVRRRAHHAGRQAAHRRGLAGRQPGVPRGTRSRLRAVVGSDGPRPVRAGRETAHARVRHDQCPVGRDQGRRLAARAAQPRRLPPRPGDGRSGARVADRRRPAPPSRLLRRHRRRWCARRRPSRGRARPRAPERDAARSR